jgi:hypothetical protein
VEYCANKNVWMTAVLFMELLRALSAFMIVQGGNTVLCTGIYVTCVQDTSF